LRETGEVARQSADRLRALRDRFPSGFSQEHLAYLQEVCSPSPAEGVTGGRTERRVSPRFPKTGTRLIIAGIPDETKEHQGTLVDQSWQGLQILCPVAVEAGRVLTVYSAIPEEGLSLCWVEVKHCRREEGGWALGCQRMLS